MSSRAVSHGSRQSSANDDYRCTRGKLRLVMHWLDIPADEMTYEWLVELIELLESTTGVTESPWIEVKSKRDGPNVAEAVGALANASGGLVIVGLLDDKDSNGAIGAARIVGVPKKEYEAISTSLAAFLANEMPEIRTIALESNPDRIVIVLRVDSDAFAHPVVVSGRVKVRAESSSINADREMIERLVHRDQNLSNPGNGIYPAPVNPEHVSFWDPSFTPFGAFRINTSMLLNRQVLNQPWIPSVVVLAAQRMMELANIPTAQWLMGALYDRELIEERHWSIDVRRVRDFRLSIAPNNPDRWPLGATGAGVAVGLNGQRLNVDLAVWFTPTEKAQPISLEDAHVLLLAMLVSTRDLLEVVVESLTPSWPGRWGSWKGWIQPSARNAPMSDLLDWVCPHSS